MVKVILTDIPPELKEEDPSINTWSFDIEAVLPKLTLTEKCELLAGINFWHTRAIPRLRIPSIRFSDGPNGVRGTKFFNGVPSACFPCGTSLAATFNVPLLEETGRLMGQEARLKSAHLILGPTINTQRSPLGGRGFESFSEDPVVGGWAAAAVVRGMKGAGVMAAVKHFVCNDQEHKRNAVQSIVTERALREIYALPFQMLVRDAEPAAVMTGYNGVNGSFCSENKELLEGMLRKEWGFKGLVMSDWFGTYSVTEAALAGLDIEMPGPPRFRGEALKFNVQTDKIPEYILDERVRAVLRLVKKAGASRIPSNGPETTGNTAETAALLRRLGHEGTVLLKNNNKLLPLAKDKKTLVIGPNAKMCTYHGGGSAALPAYYAVSPYDGIASKTIEKPQFILGSYSHKMLPLLSHITVGADGKPGMAMRVYTVPPTVKDRKPVQDIRIKKSDCFLVDYRHPNVGPLWWSEFEGRMTADEDCEFEFSLVVCGTAKLFVNGDLVIDNATKQTLGEYFFSAGTVEEKGIYQVKRGQEYTILVEFGSSPTSPLANETVLFYNGALRIGCCKVIDATQEIQRAAAAATKVDQVIICLGLNADWETEGADRESMALPGHLDDLVWTVVAANQNVVVVNQSGCPVEMPWEASVDAIVQTWYGGNETGNIIADVLFGDANPSGKLPVSWPVRGEDNPAFLNLRTEGGRVLYGEDVYVGYRYYETVKREVMWPFGWGLSYTTFALSDLDVTEENGMLIVSVTVTNTGTFAGAEVVQVYVTPRITKVLRPPKELKAFTKVDLAAGESQRATTQAEIKYAVSWWDEERHGFLQEAGEYGVVVGTSSWEGNEVVRGGFTVRETRWWKGV